jgi:hypothetical protein
MWPYKIIWYVSEAIFDFFFLGCEKFLTNKNEKCLELPKLASKLTRTPFKRAQAQCMRPAEQLS